VTTERANSAKTILAAHEHSGKQKVIFYEVYQPLRHHDYLVVNKALDAKNPGSFSLFNTASKWQTRTLDRTSTADIIRGVLRRW
jgi:hypothetical protein